VRARPPVRLLVALACGLGVAAPPAAAAARAPSLSAQLADAMKPAGALSGALVVDLGTNRTLFSLRPQTGRMPASVEKLWTTSTALLDLGPRARFVTRVFAAGRPDLHGLLRGNVYLRGGGDPTLGLGGMERIAALLRAAGVRHITGRVVGDDSLFDRLRGVPSSAFGPSPDVEPLSALAYRRDTFAGRYMPDPPLWAAQALTSLLRGDRVRVDHAAATGRTPAADGVALAALPSPPLSALIAQTNTPSDNFYAETLLKDLGARVRGSGTTAAGAAVVRAHAAAIGRHPSVVDGSGLSRADRSSPADVVALLRQMAGNAAFTSSLAVAGRTGTLADRMRGTAAAGRCRAKTGSLHDVSALAGYCTTVAGHRVAFAILINGLGSVTAARRLQDAMAIALAARG